MNQRDQELLQKQMRRIGPAPRSGGTMILAILAVFFAGMTLGGLLSAGQGKLTRVASSDATAATAPLLSALPIAR